MARVLRFDIMLSGSDPFGRLSCRILSLACEYIYFFISSFARTLRPPILALALKRGPSYRISSSIIHKNDVPVLKKSFTFILWFGRILRFSLQQVLQVLFFVKLLVWWESSLGLGGFALVGPYPDIMQIMGKSSKETS